MSSNKDVKHRMIRKYGHKCFIEELHLRSQEDIEKERRYYGKKQLAIMDQLTYHHIKERCKGGKATEENGAILRYINHQWFNRLSRQQQAEINTLFQEYKRRFNMQECKVILAEDLDVGIEIKFTEFQIPEERKKEKYNRAKVKNEFRKIIDEEVDR